MYKTIKDEIKQAMIDKNVSRKLFYKNFQNLIDTKVKEDPDLTEPTNEIISDIAKAEIKITLGLIKNDYKKPLELLISTNNGDAKTIDKLEKEIKKLERNVKKYEKFLPPLKSLEETDKIIHDIFKEMNPQVEDNVGKLKGQAFGKLTPIKKELNWDYAVEKVNEFVQNFAMQG